MRLGFLRSRLLGAFPDLVPAPRTVRRIALVKGDGMGDLVLLTGPVRDLRRKFPDAVSRAFCQQQRRAARTGAHTLMRRT